ncbi:MAG TPA: hypothetical protein VFD26_08700 [Methyloceanibacter sp.]|nr:hypothetical protein [Methyloceanibacter sp.]
MQKQIVRAVATSVNAFVFAVILPFFAPTALAEPTDITVRVLGKDSKFVGSSMGGARVIVRDAGTGEILAQGVTEGSTGDTKRIMGPQENSRAIRSSEGAAKFVATIDIDAPRLIEVEAYGPLAQPQAAHRVTATQWVVPGHHISGGDGWVLELPGYVVDVLVPPAHVKLPPETASVELRANVALMCGCPITPGGLWDADTLEVKALIKLNGEALPPVDLAFAGETSQFKGAVPVSGPGLYDVTVYAHNADNGNTGLDRTTFIVSK